MEIAITIVTSVFGACISFVLSEYLKLSKVLASALPSLVVFLVFKFAGFLHDELSVTLPVIFIGATFCGMSASAVLHKFILVLFAGIVFGIVFVLSFSLLQGFGGGIGTIACISVIISSGISKIWEFVYFKKQP